MKRYGKYGRKLFSDMENMEENCEMIWKICKKVSRIVIRCGKYGTKPSWIVKRQGKYGRNVGWIVKRCEMIWKILKKGKSNSDKI